MARVSETKSAPFISLQPQRASAAAFKSGPSTLAQIGAFLQEAGKAAGQFVDYRRQTQIDALKTELLRRTAGLQERILNNVQPEDAPGAFREQFTSATDDLLNQSDPEVARVVSNLRDRTLFSQAGEVEDKSNRLLARRRAKTLTEQVEHNREKFASTDNVLEAQNALEDIEGTVQRMFRANLIGEDQVQDVIKEQMELARIARAERLMTALKLPEARAFIDSNKDSLSAGAVKSLESSFSVADNRLEQKTRDALDNNVVNLWERVLDTPLEVDPNEIRFHPGMNRGEKEKFLSALRRSRSKVIGDVQLQSSVRHWYIHRSGRPPDPGDSDTRKVIDSYFNTEVIPTIASSLGIAPEDVALFQNAQGSQSLAEFVSRGPILPPSIEGNISGFLRAGTADQAANASDFLARIEERNPRLIKDLDDRDKSFATMAIGFMRSGMTAPEAIKLSRDATFRVSPDLLRERKLRLNQKLSDSLTDSVSGKLSPFFGPSVSDEVRAGIRGIVEAQFLNTGNEDAAKTRTLQIMERRVGVTEVGGESRISALPVEKIYGLPDRDNSEWMQEQLEFEILTGEKSIVSVEGELIREPDPKRLRTFTDHLSLRNPESPTYLVGYETENGVKAFAYDPEKGEPVRWAPEFASSPQALREETGRAKELAAANRKIQLRMKGIIEEVDFVRDSFNDEVIFGPDRKVIRQVPIEESEPIQTPLTNLGPSP